MLERSLEILEREGFLGFWDGADPSSIKLWADLLEPDDGMIIEWLPDGLALITLDICITIASDLG